MKQKPPRIEDSLIVITAMVAAQVLHETLDELRGTSFYKHKLKQITNTFQNELTASCDKTIQELYKVSDETMRCLEDGVYDIAKTLATMDPKKINELRAFIKNLK